MKPRQQLTQSYLAWIEPLLLATVIFSFWYPLAHYADMPARIPTHFGISGLPDAWAYKNLGALLLGPLILALTYAGQTFLYYWIATTDDPKKLINAPKQRLDMMSTERAELARQTSLAFLLVLKVVMVAMLAYLSYAQTNTALGHWPGLGWLPAAFLAALIIVSAAFTWQLFRLIYCTEDKHRTP